MKLFGRPHAALSRGLTAAANLPSGRRRPDVLQPRAGVPGLVPEPLDQLRRGVPLTLAYWGWLYGSAGHGLWKNSITGNAGDITG